MAYFILTLIFSFNFNAIAGYSCLNEHAAENNCRDLVKLNSDSGLGRCLAEGPPTNIAALLQRNNIQVHTGDIPCNRPGQATNLHPLNNFQDPRYVALGRVVEAYEKIGGRNGGAGPLHEILRQAEPIDVVFETATNCGTSRRNGQQIQIAHGSDQNMTGTLGASTCGGQDNHGVLAHELGHFVAGHNNNALMNAYLQHMGGSRCRLTSYCVRDEGEEFAEIIAAYVTMPQAFLGFDGQPSDRDCTKAFEFMKQTFGEPGMQMTCEARRQSYRPSQFRFAVGQPPFERTPPYRTIPVNQSTQ